MGIDEFKNKSELEQELINSVAAIFQKDFYDVSSNIREETYAVFLVPNSSVHALIRVSKEKIDGSKMEKKEIIKGQEYFFYKVKNQ